MSTPEAERFRNKDQPKKKAVMTKKGCLPYRNLFLPQLVCILGWMVAINVCVAQNKILYQQREPVHFFCKSNKDPLSDYVENIEVNQQKATAIKISGYIQARGLTGISDDGLGVFTNLNYKKTPVFWDTIIYPDTGSYPWKYVEKYIKARLPIQKIDIMYHFNGHLGEVWFRDFKIEEVSSWKDDAEVEVVLLGDSTDMIAYLPDEFKMGRRLELLLQDRFPESSITVRSLAQAGEYLKQLLESERFDREWDTLNRCDIVVIRYGLNDDDKHIPFLDFKQQLEEVCRRIQKRFPKAQIILATTIPYKTDEYDQMTRRVAHENKFPLIDIAEFLKSESKRGNGNWHYGPQQQIGFRTEQNPMDNPTGLKGDIHPNAYGVQLIAEKEFQVIEPIVAGLLHKRAPVSQTSLKTP